jgi:hypothetical protein
LLVWAQGVDGRTLTEASVEVWHELVGEYPYDEALEALRSHYAEEPRVVYPADVITRLRAAPGRRLPPELEGLMNR